MRATLWMLWVALLLTVPFPFWGIEIGRVPAARLLLLGLVTSGAAVVEGGEILPLLAFALAVQGVLAAGLLYLAARFVTTRIGRFRSVLVQRALTVVLVCGLAGLALFDVYRAPFSRSGPRTNAIGAMW